MIHGYGHAEVASASVAIVAKTLAQTGLRDLYPGGIEIDLVETFDTSTAGVETSGNTAAARSDLRAAIRDGLDTDDSDEAKHHRHQARGERESAAIRRARPRAGAR